MYRYQVGDKVQHTEAPEMTGVITKQVTFDEESGEPVDQLNPELPWYNIMWKTDSGETGEGFEHQESLKPN